MEEGVGGKKGGGEEKMKSKRTSTYYLKSIIYSRRKRASTYSSSPGKKRKGGMRRNRPAFPERPRGGRREFTPASPFLNGGKTEKKREKRKRGDGIYTPTCRRNRGKKEKSRLTSFSP